MHMLGARRLVTLVCRLTTPRRPSQLSPAPIQALLAFHYCTYASKLQFASTILPLVLSPYHTNIFAVHVSPLDIPKPFPLL
ncbi:hypothetical protein K469DRAFT_389725 [Zopfia rhizophila CBS 207.26]|uniref:Uncharacterized protein n=1 Tax=Zopfia rhizophila CBS 207.26 TaxID=1314779 RepID=A0A6A6EF09_9PEZI|nr:hypothetical protein K469DRAFT_389725 [Zopfia rhizophila CBS 207.26]